MRASVVSGVRWEEEAEEAKPRRSKSARRSSDISPTDADVVVVDVYYCNKGDAVVRLQKGQGSKYFMSREQNR